MAAPNIYQRLLQSDSMAAFYPDYVMPTIPGMDALEEPFDPSAITDVVINITVPAVDSGSGEARVWLPVAPAAPPSRGVSITAVDSNATALNVVSGSGALGGQDMRVYNSYPWVDFHSSKVGEAVAITVKASESRWNAQLIRRFATEINAIETDLVDINNARSKSVIAGEALTNGAWVYATFDGSSIKVFKADVTDPSKYPIGMVTEDLSLSDPTRIVSSGWLTGIGVAGTHRVVIPPPNRWLLMGLATGSFTWDGDTDATYALTDAHPVIPIAYHIGAGQVNINIQHSIYTGGGYA